MTHTVYLSRALDTYAAANEWMAAHAAGIVSL
jgi:hypothetical protein